MSDRNSAVIRTAPLREVRTVGELFINDAAKKQLREVAASHMTPERMLATIAKAIRTTPKLGECEPMSLLGALMTCASLGLEPNTVLGHAYLIPFFNGRKKITEVQLVVGYKGYIELAKRSGVIVSLHADVAYSDDELWTYEYGSDMHLRHKPGPRAGAKTHAYAHAKLSDGEAFVVLPWAEIIKTRDRSQGWQTAVRFGKTAESPWTVHEDRMAAKTAVRRMANSGELPLSIEFQKGMAIDGAKADFAGFAMQPTHEGPTFDLDPADAVPEGDAYDPETGEVVEEPKPAAEPRRRQADKPEPAKAEPKPEPKAEAKPAAPAGEIPKEADAKLAQIANDLADVAGDRDAWDDVLLMYEQDIANLRAMGPAVSGKLGEVIAFQEAG